MIEMTQVWERLYLGGRLDAEHLRESNPFGITSVVSLCEEKIVLRNCRVNFEHIPIAEARPVGKFKFECILNALMENLRWDTVLIHCSTGISRAPVMTAAWMHVVGYKNIDAALEEIAKLRPSIAPSKTLLASARSHLR